MKKLFTVLTTLLVSIAAVAQTQVIAHRGYWKAKGSAQNSITALKKADKLRCYGSEFDVWLTRDGKLLVNHDPTFNGVRLETTDYDTLSTPLILKNGEPLPTLAQFLTNARKLKVGLILEIKKHAQTERTLACVDSVLKMVSRMGLEKRMTYISFSYDAVKRLKQLAPEGTQCYYLNGDIAPQQIKDDGLDGIDYNGHVLKDLHPDWIDLCHRLGLKVNVWTIDKDEDLRYFISRGADFITTNEPKQLISLLKQHK